MNQSQQIIALLESISKIVYHATDLSSLDSIVKGNRFQLSAEQATSSDMLAPDRRKLFFMSLARNLSSAYIRRNWKPVILKLDGEKLNQKYSGGPVDYWGRQYRLADPSRSEQEDRLWSPDAFIDNASKYLLEVHIHVDPERNTKWMNKTTRQSMIELHKRKIPVFVYPDVQDFLKLNKSKAVPVKDANLSGSPEASRERVRRDEIKLWMELWGKKDKAHLSTEPFGGAVRKLESLRSLHDTMSSLQSDLHNDRQLKGEKASIELYKLLRKENMTLDDFIWALRKKWFDWEKPSERTNRSYG